MQTPLEFHEEVHALCSGRAAAAGSLIGFANALLVIAPALIIIAAAGRTLWVHARPERNHAVACAPTSPSHKGSGEQGNSDAAVHEGTESMLQDYRESRSQGCIAVIGRRHVATRGNS